MSTAPNGMRVLVYAGGHAAATAASYIPVVGLFAGGANAHSSSITFRFEPAGRLIDYSTSQSDVHR